MLRSPLYKSSICSAAAPRELIRQDSGLLFWHLPRIQSFETINVALVAELNFWRESSRIRSLSMASRCIRLPLLLQRLGRPLILVGSEYPPILLGNYHPWVFRIDSILLYGGCRTGEYLMLRSQRVLFKQRFQAVGVKLAKPKWWPSNIAFCCEGNVMWSYLICYSIWY